MVGQQTAGDLEQGVFAGNLCVEAGQKLSPRGKMLAVAVPGGLLDHFVETISGDELEKLLNDAILWIFPDFSKSRFDFRGTTVYIIPNWSTR